MNKFTFKGFFTRKDKAQKETPNEQEISSDKTDKKSKEKVYQYQKPDSIELLDENSVMKKHQETFSKIQGKDEFKDLINYLKPKVSIKSEKHEEIENQVEEKLLKISQLENKQVELRQKLASLNHELTQLQSHYNDELKNRCNITYEILLRDILAANPKK